MSVLPDHQIEFMSGPTRRMIHPFDYDQLQPASYDCRLSDKLLVPHLRSHTAIDLREPADDRTELVSLDDLNGFVLTSGRAVLGATIEKVSIPDFIVGRIEGKSSLARKFVQIHSAGYLDPGFRGNVTLEIVNLGPDSVVLWPGIMIAQLSFEFLDSSCRRPYNGHYQDSDGVVASRYGHDAVGA